MRGCRKQDWQGQYLDSDTPVMRGLATRDWEARRFPLSWAELRGKGPGIDQSLDAAAPPPTPCQPGAVSLAKAASSPEGKAFVGITQQQSQQLEGYLPQF